MSAARRVLFVDDDDMIRTAFARGLSGQGFEIETAKNGLAAIEMANDTEYAVIATDYRMPGINGLETTEELRSIQPDATYMLISGNCDLNLALDAVNDYEVAYVIPKPWNVDDLTTAIQRGIEQYVEKSTQRKVAASMVEASRRLEEKEARLREALAKSEDNVADALLGSLELRDRETQAACRRVAASAVLLAKEMGLAGKVLKDIERGALLHDIGKIGIPDSILLKPGPLSLDEWAVMRTHPEIGARLLSDIEIMKPIKQMVTQHHEKWDGSGYPLGLSGKAICIGARVLAVVDTLDAIMSNRPYRKGAPYAVAAEEIQRCAGSQFDPMVVEAFLRIPEKSWLMLRERYKDNAAAAA